MHSEALNPQREEKLLRSPLDAETPGAGERDHPKARVAKVTTEL
jgi:hypothetical protein